MSKKRYSTMCDDQECLCHWIEGHVHCTTCGALIDVSGPAGLDIHRCPMKEPMEKAKPITYEEDGDVLWA